MSDDVPAFVDTNVLVYAFDQADPGKRKVAAGLLEDLAGKDRLRLSTQVLQEFFVTITRKIESPLSSSEALAIVEDMAEWPVQVIEVTDILRAGRLRDEASLSFWDALIVVAARKCGADTLYSEDMSAGEAVLGVRIINPFL